MRRRFGLLSAQCPDFLTLGGRIITHHSREQMEWLHPGATVTEIPPGTPPQSCMPLWEHPDYLGAFDHNGDIIRGVFRDQS